MKEQDMNKDIEQPQQPETALKDTSGVMMEGHIRIFDPETGEDYVNKRNAIHNENMSEALAQVLIQQVLLHICQQTVAAAMQIYTTKHTIKL